MDSRDVDIVNVLGVRMTLLVLAVLVGEAIVGVTIAVAVLMAHTHKGRNHHWLMLGAFSGDLLVVKPLMIYRVWQGFFGDFPYPHTSGLPHISLAVTAACVGAVNIWLGYRYRIRSAKSRNFHLGPKGRRHRLVGTSFLILWSATLIYGTWIFYTTYIRP